jgi:hypothetical protein
VSKNHKISPKSKPQLAREQKRCVPPVLRSWLAAFFILAYSVYGFRIIRKTSSRKLVGGSAISSARKDAEQRRHESETVRQPVGGNAGQRAASSNRLSDDAALNKQNQKPPHPSAMLQTFFSWTDSRRSGTLRRLDLFALQQKISKYATFSLERTENQNRRRIP